MEIPPPNLWLASEVGAVLLEVVPLICGDDAYSSWLKSELNCSIAYDMPIGQ